VNRSLLQLTLARLREFVREPGTLFWTFGFPLALTMALGIAFRSGGPEVHRVAVVDGPDAAALAATLDALPELRAEVVPRGDADLGLRRGRFALAVTAEPGGGLVYRFDPGRPEGPTARRLADAALQRAAGRVDPRVVRDERVDAPGARYIDWLVPGLLGMQLLSGSLWGIAWPIVNARQKKLLKRFVATPMRRRDYLLSFLLARLVPLAVEVPLLFGFARLAFGVRIQGPLLAVIVLVLAGALSFAGLGLLCAARATNTETVNGLVNLATLPMFVCSGVFFPASRFPDFLQLPIRLLPLTAFNDALRAVVNEGAGLAAAGTELGILAAWGLATFAAALAWFRWV
jgi:ABC-type multidrug transport system permease subunit